MATRDSRGRFIKGGGKTALVEKDNGWKAFAKTVGKLDDKQVVVGIPGEINFDVPTTAAIGMVHEFGSLDGTIPERSFLRSTFDGNRRKYASLLEKFVKASLKSRKPNTRSLTIVGEIVRGDIVKRVRDKDIKQDLQPATIARKGSDTALVDTGNLIGSIVSQVRKA